MKRFASNVNVTCETQLLTFNVSLMTFASRFSFLASLIPLTPRHTPGPSLR